MVSILCIYRRHEEEEEEDEHTIKYNFPSNQTKGLTPGLFIKLIRSINTPLEPSCEPASKTTASTISN